MNDNDSSKETQELLMNGKYQFSNESCSHYAVSNAMYVFPCCDKQYPCSICLNLKEEHESEVSKQGYCKVCKFWNDNIGDNCKKCGVVFCDNEEVEQLNNNPDLKGTI